MEEKQISLEAAKREIQRFNGYIDEDMITRINIALTKLGTVGEQKTGKWIIKTINTFSLAYGSTGYEPVYECSVCGRVTESYLRLDEPIMPEDADFPNFCPECGARMEGEQDG